MYPDHSDFIALPSGSSYELAERKVLLVLNLGLAVVHQRMLADTPRPILQQVA